MFPPHPEKLSEICKQGFEDTLAYLKVNSMYLVFFENAVVSTRVFVKKNHYGGKIDKPKTNTKFAKCRTWGTS